MQKIGRGVSIMLSRWDLFGQPVELQLNIPDLAKQTEKMEKIKALCVSNRAYGV
ncbi:MAG: hypothetical protein U5K35_10000 [Rhodohalobacter sp.]|nr:hypothetical protein [Rhodohalobacter sp.]